MGREQLRATAKAIRARKRAEALAEISNARSQSRGSCESRKVQARERTKDSLQRAAAVLAAEREHQELLLRWARAPKLSGPKKRSKPTESIAESDSEVENNVPPELVPVFRSVRAKIKSSPRRTRTEAFLEWAQSHPGDVLTILDAQLERDVAKLVAEEKQLARELSKRSTYARATEADLLRRYEAYAGAPEVPF